MFVHFSVVGVEDMSSLTIGCVGCNDCTICRQIIMNKSNTNEVVDTDHSDLASIILRQSYVVRVVCDATDTCINTIYQPRVARTPSTVCF
jgi:hypothetical protein